MTTPASLGFQLTFAGVPFISDAPEMVPSPAPIPEAVRKFVEMDSSDIYAEIERKIPFEFLTEYVLPSQYPGRNCGAIAYPWQTGPLPSPEVRIGTYYYPTTASRWSVFRGLMTSSMYKAVRAATSNLSKPGTFVMKQVPDSPGFTNTTANFTISTNMYMLPGRCLSETASQDGLYLVTLVDERYWWQYNPSNLRPTPGTTWNKFITQLGESLGVTITVGTIPSVYTNPETDSQFWSNQESAALLLDAVAFNIGTNLVRNLNGTYTLQTPLSSQATVNNNRGNASQLVRLAGGDMFASGNPMLPTGRLDTARNAVLTPSIVVTFPKYIVGDDPVPHNFNPRYQPSRPSTHYEESYGDTFVISVPLSSGGTQFQGLTGVIPTSGTNAGLNSGVDFASGYSHCIHDTAKALYSGEAQVGFNSGPVNQSGLTALAIQLAQDYWNAQVASALDEVYPGTFVWTPEGIHDIIWTYSDRKGIASCRVLRAEWNQIIREMQHATPPLPNQTANVRGVGGRSIAQTWRDTTTQGGSTNTLATLSSGGLSVALVSGLSLPQKSRWRGTIESETLLFEGLSGGSTANIVYRGIDGSIQTSHNSGVSIAQVVPNTTYGVNLVTAGGALQATPGAWTSGGISEVVLNVASGGITPTMLGSGFLSSGIIGSGIIASGAINVFNLAIYNWPQVYNPVYAYSGYGGQNPILLSGVTNYNNLAIGSTPKLLIASLQNITITGIVAGLPGQLLYIVNEGPGLVKFTNQDGNSLPVDQFTFPWKHDFILYVGREFILQYDPFVQNWIPAHPIMAVGDGNGHIDTYGCDFIIAGTGLTSIDNGDGSNTLSVTASNTGKTYQTFRLKKSLLSRWYQGGEPSGTVGGTPQTISANTLIAIPIFNKSARTLEALGFNVGTAEAGSHARIGLYDTVADNDPYPNNLIEDGGDQDCSSTGDKITSGLSIALAADTLYWLVILTSSSVQLQITCFPSASAFFRPVLGVSSPAGNPGIGWTTAQAYGALPTPFPSNPGAASLIAATIPALAMRFSA